MSFTGTSSCIKCPSSQPFSQPDRTECGAYCPPGVSDLQSPGNEGVCMPCPPCTYSDTFETFCDTCPTGKYSERVNGSTTCGFCPPGTYQVAMSSFHGGFCTNCSTGTYSEGGVGSCTLCGAEESSGEGASACSSCVPGQDCAYCDPGFIPKLVANENKGCTSCLAGKYLDLYAGTTCTSCVAGMFVEKSNATACTTCTVRCSAPNFYRSSECAASHDLQCQQFQQELSFGSKIAMIFAPFSIALVLFWFIRYGPERCIPTGSVFTPLRSSDLLPVMPSKAWEDFKNSEFLEPNSCKSLKAAAFTLLTASLDVLSNIQMLILLSRDAPHGMYIAQLVSVLVTLVVDGAMCWIRPGAPKHDLSGAQNLQYVWLYMLECQELDPAWDKLESQHQKADKIKTIQ